MRINESNPDVVRSDTAGRIREEGPGGSEEKARPVAPASRADRVEISEEARALAQQARADEAGQVELTPDRIAEIKARIVGHFYDQPEVIADVADRLLDSGDL